MPFYNELPIQTKGFLFILGIVLFFFIVEILFLFCRKIILNLKERKKRQFFKRYNKSLKKQDKTIRENYKKGITDSKDVKNIYTKTR